MGLLDVLRETVDVQSQLPRSIVSPIINLSDFTTNGNIFGLGPASARGGWIPLGIPGGDRLIYRKGGSTPGGLLVVRLDQSVTVENFSPGNVINYPFKKAEVMLSQHSLPFGFARLVSSQGPGPFGQFEDEGADPFPLPVNLIPVVDVLGPVAVAGGTPGVGAYLTKNIQPGAAGNLTMWPIIGLKVIRLHMVFTAATTTVTLIPWFAFADRRSLVITGNWWENGVGSLVIPDTNTTGGLRRVVTMDLRRMGNPWAWANLGAPNSIINVMALELVNAGAADANVSVEGVE